MALKLGIDKGFDEGLGRFVRMLDDLASDVPKFFEQALEGIAQKAAKTAKDLTPRSEGSGPHVADAWTSERADAGDRVTFVVRNTDQEANADVRLADGSTQPYSLLHILEYGSAPHEITPHLADRLVFFWPRLGRQVRAKKVDHPGTRPYAMLQIASTEAAVDVKLAIDAVRALVRLGGAPRKGFFSPRRGG